MVFFFFFFVNQTALHLACQQSSLEIVKLIVEDRAKVNIPNNIFFLIIINQISNCFILMEFFFFDLVAYMTPLHFACIRGDLEIVKYLVSRKAIVDVFDSMI